MDTCNNIALQDQNRHIQNATVIYHSSLLGNIFLPYLRSTLLHNLLVLIYFSRYFSISFLVVRIPFSCTTEMDKNKKQSVILFFIIINTFNADVIMVIGIVANIIPSILRIKERV